MPRQVKELSASEVKRLTAPGSYAVGGVTGLYLVVGKTGGRSWILRTTVGGKRREMGLGGYPTVTLAEAREKARDLRDKAQGGIDPVADRKAAQARLKAEQAKELTFDEAVERYLSMKVTEHEFRNAKHRAQWASTLRTYACPVIGPMRVCDVEMTHIETMLTRDNLWTNKHETASRLRQRVERVLDWCTVGGHRSGDNPARWKGNLEHRLAGQKQLKRQKRHHSALPIDDMPRFMADLRTREGMPARFVEFCILTACRSGEARGAAWSEIDLAKRVWVIPAERMKAGRQHRVPLSDAAVKLLESLPRETGDLIFPSPSGQNKQLSVNAGRQLLVRMEYQDSEGRTVTLHGFRSTFRDWIGERTYTPNHVAELALAHTIKSDTESSYRRGDLLEKRAPLMEQWAHFVEGDGQCP